MYQNKHLTYYFFQYQSKASCLLHIGPLITQMYAKAANHKTKLKHCSSTWNSIKHIIKVMVSVVVYEV